MGEWHGHIVEDHMRWEMLFWPYLENTVCHIAALLMKLHKITLHKGRKCLDSELKVNDNS